KPTQGAVRLIGDWTCQGPLHAAMGGALPKAVTLTLDYRFAESGPAGRMATHEFDCRWGAYSGHESEPFYLVRVLFNQTGTAPDSLVVGSSGSAPGTFPV